MRWVLAIVCALVLTGCGIVDTPVAIRTREQPSDMCLLALVGGVLVPDPNAGLAFRGVDGGPNLPIRWPFGWTARRQWGAIILFNAAGKAVAREGDTIRAAGGYASDVNGHDASVMVDCDVQVNPSPEP